MIVTARTGYSNTREARLFSRSPSQATLPRHFRMRSWRFDWTSSLSASSTTARFVGLPLARQASAMSLSSISMFVRM